MPQPETLATTTPDDDLIFLEDAPIEDAPLNDADIIALLPRPTRRSQCREGVRPCPWVSCRHHLYLEVSGRGRVKLNFRDREPDEMALSCSLDLAEDGPRTLDQVAILLGMSRERVRQIEEEALVQIRRDWHAGELLSDDGLDDGLD